MKLKNISILISLVGSIGLIFYFYSIKNTNEDIKIYQLDYQNKISDKNKSPIVIIKPMKLSKELKISSPLLVEAYVRPQFVEEDLLAMQIISNDGVIKASSELKFTGELNAENRKIFRGQIIFQTENKEGVLIVFRERKDKVKIVSDSLNIIF